MMIKREIGNLNDLVVLKLIRLIMNEKVDALILEYGRRKVLLTNRKVNYHVILYSCSFNNIVVTWITHLLHHGWYYSHPFGNCNYNGLS